jgi:predicted ArsR family transcriptional regulator
MPALDQAENGLSPTLAREHTKLACRMNLTMLAAVTGQSARLGLAARFEPASDRCCVVLDVD